MTHPVYAVVKLYGWFVMDWPMSNAPLSFNDFDREWNVVSESVFSQ